MAATVRIQVSPDAVEGTAKAIEADVTRYRDSYMNVYRASDEMIGHWAGKDNLAYNQKLNDFRQDLVRMEQLMQEYIAFLIRSAAHYRSLQGDIIIRVPKPIDMLA